MDVHTSSAGRRVLRFPAERRYWHSKPVPSSTPKRSKIKLCLYGRRNVVDAQLRTLELLASLPQTCMHRILRYLGHHGLWRTAHRVVHAACNSALPYHAFAVMWMPASFVSEPNDSASQRLQIRKLSREEAFQVSRLPGTGMPEIYVHHALDRGDECLGVIIDGKPACVCWFAHRPPVALYHWWNVEFLDEYVYVHGAYTAPAYRGKRLLEHNLHAAVARYSASGAAGMFALVESSNYASLNAFRRAGYIQRGTIRVAKIKGRFLVRHDSACLDARVFVTPIPKLKTVDRSRETLTPAA